MREEQHAAPARDVTAAVKLTRNTLMAPLIVLFGIIYQRGQSHRMNEKAVEASRLKFSKLVPGFVVGFLILSLMRTLGVAVGVLPQNAAHPGSLVLAANFLTAVDDIGKFAILIALAGVGLNTDLSSLRKIGFKPLIVGTCVATVLAVISLGLILLTPLGR